MTEATIIAPADLKLIKEPNTPQRYPASGRKTYYNMDTGAMQTADAKRMKKKVTKNMVQKDEREAMSQSVMIDEGTQRYLAKHGIAPNVAASFLDQSRASRSSIKTQNYVHSTHSSEMGTVIKDYNKPATRRDKKTRTKVAK